MILKSSLVILLGLSACATTTPSIQPRIYKGDHQKGSIVRAQAGEEIKCQDPAFSNYVCLEKDEFAELAGQALSCQK